MTQNRLILLTSIFLLATGNLSFFAQTMQIYPPATENIGFLLSLAVFFIGLNIFLFALFSSRYTTKPLLILVLLISSLTAYFMDTYHVVIDTSMIRNALHTYHVVIDTSMIRNALQTNLAESLDLLSIKLLGYFLFLGILPSCLVYYSKIPYPGLRKALIGKIVMLLLSILVMAGSMYLFSKHYTSFIREHKPLRYHANPSYWVYSVVKYINKTYFDGPVVVQPVGRDAVIDANQSKTLVVMVVGEAARADHFSLNGYSKQTNPELSKLDIINYPNFYSCGTSTAASVPCMFSKFSRKAFDYKKGISYENVLDILNHTGKVSLLWRDNNSDSKGVALRIPYQDYRSSAHNSICSDGECRDEGMLLGLDRWIADQNRSNLLIILHQMGNHGPAYYKRYPSSYRQFNPVCRTNQLEQCSQEEIRNAYDNALRYTDAFLAKSIALLKPYDSHYQTALLYVADHGESLGENSVYLHGMPYFMAPDAQKHVGALLWLGKGMKKTLNVDKLKQRTDAEYSHDALFHTLLGLFHVQTKEYKPQLDLLHGVR